MTRKELIAGVLEAFNTQRTPSGVYGDRVRLKAAHGGDTGRRPTGPTNRIPGTGTKPLQQGRVQPGVREAIIDRILEMGVGGVGSVSMSMGTSRVQSKPKTPLQPPVRPQRPISKRIPY